MEKPRQRLISGIALIVLGLGLWYLQRLDGLGAATFLLLIGGAFLAAYLYFRNYGYLVPGCIMLGLGVGTVAEDSRFNFGDSMLLGLGFGFVAIYVISLLYERKNRWWPLIPGGIMLLVGFGAEDFVDTLIRNWPLILVLIGILIVLGAIGGSRRGQSGP